MSTTTPAVRSSEAARYALGRLSAAGGPLLIRQAGGCCGTPLVARADGPPLGSDETAVGVIAGVPVYVSSHDLTAWDHGDIELDVEVGYPDGFSLAAGDGLRFVARPVAHSVPRLARPPQPTSERRPPSGAAATHTPSEGDQP